MAKFIDCYGVTTFTFTAGISTITGISAGPSVNDMFIVGTTGDGVLYFAGASVGVSAMVLGGQGAILNVQSQPISLGVSNLFFTAQTDTVVVSILKRLDAGYAGSPGNTGA